MKIIGMYRKPAFSFPVLMTPIIIEAKMEVNSMHHKENWMMNSGVIVDFRSPEMAPTTCWTCPGAWAMACGSMLGSSEICLLKICTMKLDTPNRMGAPKAAGARAAKHHGTRARSGAGGGGTAGEAMLALAAVAGTVLVLALACSLLAGASRVRHALDDDAAPAIDELARALEHAGWPAAGAGTLTRIAAALRGEGRTDAAAYVELLRRARFAPSAAGATRPASDLEIAEGRAALRRALGRRGGLGTRLRAWYGLPPAFAGRRMR